MWREPQRSRLARHLVRSRWDIAKREAKRESEKKEEKKTDNKDKGTKIGDTANAVGGAVNKIKGLFGKKKND